MKNKINPVAIGMFVLGAVAISVVTIMLFGAAKFFSDTQVFVSYFTESVNGLDVGAPVKYKGVTIGKVVEITISPSVEQSETSVAIFYSIDFDLVRRKIRGSRLENFDNWLDGQINDGLRAKLNYQSIVTGMLYIELDYLADKGAKYQTYYGGTMFTEIPSSKSGLSELGKAVEKTVLDISKIDFSGIGKNLSTLLQNANKKLDAVDTKALNDSAIAALNGVRDITENPDLKNSLKNLDKLLLNADTTLNVMRDEFSLMSKNASGTLEKMNGLISNVDSMIAPQSPFRYELSMLLRNLSESLSSISNLSDYIQRNPSSLITGKSLRTQHTK